MPSSMPIWVSRGPGLQGERLDDDEHERDRQAAQRGRRSEAAQGERAAVALATGVNAILGLGVLGLVGAGASRRLRLSSEGMPAKGRPGRGWPTAATALADRPTPSPPARPAADPTGHQRRPRSSVGASLVVGVVRGSGRATAA